MKNEFTAIIEPAEEGGYWAFCPEVPGANGQGETIDEVIQDLSAAIKMMLDYLREKGCDEASDKAERKVVTVVA